MLAGGVDVNLLPREVACCAGERVMYHTIFRLEPKEASSRGRGDKPAPAYHQEVSCSSSASLLSLFL